MRLTINHQYRRGLLAATMLTIFVATPFAAASAAVVFDAVSAGDMTGSDAILWTRADNGGATTSLTAQVSANASFTDGATTSMAGRFTTAPSVSQSAPIAFGFSGDVDGRFRPYPSANGFGTTARGTQNLNFFTFLGDTMYETAATGSPATVAATTNGSNAAQVLLDYHRKYLENIKGVTAVGAASTTGQQGVRQMLAATGSYTLLDNHELGNRQLQAGGAPRTSANTGNPLSIDVNATGAYNNKSAGFQALQQAYMDYHATRDITVPAGPTRSPITASPISCTC